MSIGECGKDWPIRDALWEKGAETEVEIWTRC
jgi:hypothetical protein